MSMTQLGHIFKQQVLNIMFSLWLYDEITYSDI